jgi:hypothetical protein
MNTNSHATVRRTAHAVLLAVAAAAALWTATPAQPAAANPKAQAPSPVHTQQAHQAAGCADQLRDLTVYLRDIGFTGQASHIAAQLTLGC